MSLNWTALQDVYLRIHLRFPNLAAVSCEAACFNLGTAGPEEPRFRSLEQRRCRGNCVGR